MKVKTFNNLPDAEINIWLDQHPEIVSHHVTQSQSTVNNEPYVVHTLWYSEPTPLDYFMSKADIDAHADAWSQN